VHFVGAVPLSVCVRSQASKTRLLREQQCELEAELPVPGRADAAWTSAEDIVKCLYLRIESLAGEFEHTADAAA
jgi:hypothetical protein